MDCRWRTRWCHSEMCVRLRHSLDSLQILRQISSIAVLHNRVQLVRARSNKRVHILADMPMIDPTHELWLLLCSLHGRWIFKSYFFHNINVVVDYKNSVRNNQIFLHLLSDLTLYITPKEPYPTFPSMTYFPMVLSVDVGIDAPCPCMPCGLGWA